MINYEDVINNIFNISVDDNETKTLNDIISKFPVGELYYKKYYEDIEIANKQFKKNTTKFKNHYGFSNTAFPNIEIIIKSTHLAVLSNKIYEGFYTALVRKLTNKKPINDDIFELSELLKNPINLENGKIYNLETTSKYSINNDFCRLLKMNDIQPRLNIRDVGPLPNNNLDFVSHVETLDNGDRAAIIISNGINSYLTKYKYKFIKCNPQNSIYNYLDVGRLFIFDKKNDIIGIFDNDMELQTLKSIDIDFDKLITDVTKSKNLPVIVNKSKLLKYQDLSKVMNNTKLMIQDKMLSKIQTLNNGITINGLSVNLNGFSYENLKISTKDYDLKNLLSNCWKYLISEVKRSQRNNSSFDINTVINFNVLFNDFFDGMSSVFRKYQYSTFTFEINTANYRVKIEKRNNKKFYINDIRVNREELVECLKRTICYDNKEDYENFLSIVSKCSLQNHKLIDSGITTKVILSRDIIYLVKLNLTRNKSKNYLVLGDRKIQIKKLTQFNNRLVPRVTILNFCNLCSSDNYFNEKLTTEDVINLINDGKQRYLDAVKKSEELLNDTIKSLNITVKQNYTYDDITCEKAYEITGKSGNEYVVVENSDNHSGNTGVYKKNGKTLSYVCIVDKNLGDQVGKDKLVNRFYALANDSKVIDKISTLKPLVKE